MNYKWIISLQLPNKCRTRNIKLCADTFGEKKRLFVSTKLIIRKEVKFF